MLFLKKIPSKRVREKFNLIYELQGAQKAIDYLAQHYKINTMKIVANGRKVGNDDHACYDYDDFTAYFKKDRICKRLVLHEFYHHLAFLKDWDISDRREEREAERFSSMFRKRVLF